MPRSFDIVDRKLAEADFFLEHLQAESGVLEASFYFSAFLSAARSVTFALQAALNYHPEFEGWYQKKQAFMKKRPLCKFFLDYRNATQKEGDLAVATSQKHVLPNGEIRYRHLLMRKLSGEHRSVEDTLAAMFTDYDGEDAVELSKNHLGVLTYIVKDCYQTFGFLIDPRMYYTLENLQRLGLTIGDVEEELGFPRGWTDADGASDADRLQALRRNIPIPDVDWLFDKYPLLEER